jgi:hypothetical protein
MGRQQYQKLNKASGGWNKERQCGKVGFPSKRAAEGRARVLGLRAYKCQTCGRWHLAK